MSLNSCTFTGRLTKEAEIRESAKGTTICTFRLAVNRVFYNPETNEKEEDTLFLDVVNFGKQGEAIKQYLVKGAQVGVTGRLRLEDYEANDGSGKKTSVSLVANDIRLL